MWDTKPRPFTMFGIHGNIITITCIAYCNTYIFFQIESVIVNSLLEFSIAQAPATIIIQNSEHSAAKKKTHQDPSESSQLMVNPARSRLCSHFIASYPYLPMPLMPLAPLDRHFSLSSSMGSVAVCAAFAHLALSSFSCL